MKHTPLLSIVPVLTMLGCFPSPDRPPAPPPAPVDTMTKSSFSSLLDNFRRSSEDQFEMVELEEAKFQSLRESLSDKARKDPQAAVIDKTHDKLVADTLELRQRFDETIAWAEERAAAPDPMDPSKLSQEHVGISAGLSALHSRYARVNAELQQLKAMNQ